MKTCIINFIALSIVPILYIVGLLTVGLSVPDIPDTADAVGFWLFIAIIGYIIEVTIALKLQEKK